MFKNTTWKKLGYSLVLVTIVLLANIGKVSPVNISVSKINFFEFISPSPVHYPSTQITPTPTVATPSPAVHNVPFAPPTNISIPEFVRIHIPKDRVFKGYSRIKLSSPQTEKECIEKAKTYALNDLRTNVKNWVTKNAPVAGLALAAVQERIMNKCELETTIDGMQGQECVIEVQLNNSCLISGI